MHSLASPLIAAVAVMAAPLALAQPQEPTPTEASEEHKWLAQLVGAWTVTADGAFEPAAEAVPTESVDETRAIGDLWVQSELRGKMMGTDMQALMTLGYDAKKKAFVGTWIDTFQTHMWHYEGQLDAKKRALTLSATGPSFEDPNETSNYHDIITIVDADTRTLTSEVQSADGTWTQFMKIKYTRVADGEERSTGPARNMQEPETEKAIPVHYLEIVTPDVDATCNALGDLHDVSFGRPEPGIGNARTAVLRGGGWIGVRAPMRKDEAPVVRPYLLVDDIATAVSAATEAGGEFAVTPTEIPGHGTFAIYFLGGVQYGLWKL